MPKRNIEFNNGDFYHIIKRGVEQRKIFLDDEDRLRFLNSLLIFNDKNPTTWNSSSFWNLRDPASLNSLMVEDSDKRNHLVKIHSFAFMDNHFHLLVQQLVDNGISNFMNKLGGYSYYFNKKYKRVGPLFQGRFKAVPIKTDNQLKNIFVYINTNPVGLIWVHWKEEGIKDFKKAVDTLENYKWSSYPDYLGGKNFPFLLEKDFFLELFGNSNGCKDEVEMWLKYKVELDKYKDFL